MYQHLNAIDRDLMSDVVGGAQTALSLLKTACPTPESYDTSAECKKADAHYVKVLKAMASPHAAAPKATLAPAHR